MYAKVKGYSIIGIKGHPIDIEVDLANGLPQFQIVGLPDSSIRESKDRVRAAIKNSNYEFPLKRITVNLAPADIRKEGSAFDLPISIGILLAAEQIKIHNTVNIEETLLIGELSLDGTLQSVNGILPIAIAAKENGIKNIIIPENNYNEASLVIGINVFGFSNIKEVINYLENTNTNKSINISNTNTSTSNMNKINDPDDFDDVKGQYQVKRSIEVAVAGMHNLLMIGPPGSGKSMLAKRIPGILPDLTWDETLEIMKIYSVVGELKGYNKIISKRPFRNPHHSISVAGLIGGGANPKPGEISLAHRGLLFLDEVAEFPRGVLESLRQPLEDGKVNISRARASYIYPSKFMLVGAMNPCKCGYYGTDVPNHQCQCTPSEVNRYRNKISGPFLDRFDLHIEVPWVNIQALRDNKKERNSKNMKESINKARKIQIDRFANININFNSEMNTKLVKKHCCLDSKAEELLNLSFNHYGLSGRSLDRILKLSRTIADLDESEDIKLSHLAESLNYRVLDRRS